VVCPVDAVRAFLAPSRGRPMMTAKEPLLAGAWISLASSPLPAEAQPGLVDCRSTAPAGALDNTPDGDVLGMQHIGCLTEGEQHDHEHQRHRRRG
jgi:hypothetical protein